MTAILLGTTGMYSAPLPTLNTFYISAWGAGGGGGGGGDQGDDNGGAGGGGGSGAFAEIKIDGLTSNHRVKFAVGKGAQGGAKGFSGGGSGGGGSATIIWLTDASGNNPETLLVVAGGGGGAGGEDEDASSSGETGYQGTGGSLVGGSSGTTNTGTNATQTSGVGSPGSHPYGADAIDPLLDGNPLLKGRGQKPGPTTTGNGHGGSGGGGYYAGGEGAQLGSGSKGGSGGSSWAPNSTVDTEYSSTIHSGVKITLTSAASGQPMTVVKSRNPGAAQGSSNFFSATVAGGGQQGAQQDTSADSGYGGDGKAVYGFTSTGTEITTTSSVVTVDPSTLTGAT